MSEAVLWAAQSGKPCPNKIKQGLGLDEVTPDGGQLRASSAMNHNAVPDDVLYELIADVHSALELVVGQHDEVERRSKLQRPELRPDLHDSVERFHGAVAQEYEQVNSNA